VRGWLLLAAVRTWQSQPPVTGRAMTCLVSVACRRRHFAAGSGWLAGLDCLTRVKGGIRRVQAGTVTVKGVRYCGCGQRLARDHVGERCGVCERAAAQRELVAPQVPAEFWDTPAFGDAFDAQHMGMVARAYRRHPFHVAAYGAGGIPQTLLGGWLGLTQAQVSRLENGPPFRNLDTLAQWARVLQIPPGLLWFKLPGSQSPIRSVIGPPGLPAPALTDLVAAGIGLTGDGMNFRWAETDHAVRANHGEWLAVRRNLRRNRADLTHLVSELYPDSARLADTGILMPGSWRLQKPVDLSSVRLEWQERAPAPRITGQHEETLRLRPLVTQAQRYTRYHRAVRDLDRPRLFENRLCYRLIDVGVAEGDHAAPALAVGGMSYFDMIDVGEALAHEAALVAVDRYSNLHRDLLDWASLPFRRLAADPFDLVAYPLMLSVSTLTVRRSPAGCTFLLLRRDPARVAVAGGMLSVFPTGVFQPASVGSHGSEDFDLWRNIMREYSEEYLGNPEHDGDGPPIDYENDEPFKSLDLALSAGRLRVLCLGLGIDALNYVGDVFTIVVFDSDVFDQVFGRMVEENDEGSVDRQVFTFDDHTIKQLLQTEPLAPSGAACLHLAWQHRDSFL
jgi:hypothetical protein